MIYFRIFVFLLILIAQPLRGSENSGLFTVDMSKLLRSSDFGKRIILANNRARQELQKENEDLELKLQAYPEFNRYQSNNTMYGAFFSKIGANVYTKGTSFTSERLTSFHKKLIEKDPDKLNK